MTKIQKKIAKNALRIILSKIYTVHALTLFTQAFTYYASEDKLTNRGNEAGNHD